MQFEQSKKIEKVGEKVGFVLSYALFTTILYFAFVFLKKIPGGWNYSHFLLITLTIVVVGFSIKKFLK